MNPVILGQLRKFSELNEISELHRSDQFEIYTIYSCLNGFIGENIDPYELHLKGSEFGIDGVGILVQGQSCRNASEAREEIAKIKNPTIEFYFFQSKSGEKFDFGEISKFFAAIQGFFSNEIQGESPELDDLMAAKDIIYETGVEKNNPSIRCFYASTGNYEHPKMLENLRKSFTAELQSKNIFNPKQIATHFAGAKELQNWYRSATTAASSEIEFTRNVVMPSIEQVDEGYIGYIDAENLLKLFYITDEDGANPTINKSVFFDNIRDYNPNSKLNNSIKQSAISGSGTEFVYRNNGVTVVAKNIERTGDRFRLEEYQIVNGCQTSNIIFELKMAGSNGDEDSTSSLVSNINIPFRLIGSKDPEFINSIIVGTNTQNKVNDEQFWAMNPFIKSLEEYFSSLPGDDSLFLERRENQYKTLSVERTRTIPLQILMKTIVACLLDAPHRAARNHKASITENKDRLFQEKQDVRIYHAICYLHYRIEFMWRNQRLDHISKTYRHYILWGICQIAFNLNDIFSFKKNDLARIASKLVDLSKDEDGLISLVEQVNDLVTDVLDEMNITEQEKIRDTIRSASFYQEVKAAITANFRELTNS